MTKSFYAVKKGRHPGIYESWPECQEEVMGYKGASYKKFKTYDEALAFIEGSSIKDSRIIESKEDLEELSKDELVAYVDGSFSKDKHMYSYGVVLLANNRKESLYGVGLDRSLADMRNVSGELKGAIVAMNLAIAKGYKKLYLHYDYEGIEKWARGSWKTNKEGTKKYKDYYEEIREVLEVEFIKVPAHRGIKYNEEADGLAKKAFL